MKKKIKLLHLIKTLDVGGIEKSTILYSNYLYKKLDLISIYASKGFYDNSNFLSKNVQRFYPPHYIENKKHFIKNLKHLISVVKEEKITHVHYHHRIFIPYIFVINLILPKIKIVYTHHSIFNDVINNFIIADFIICLNKNTKQDLPKRFWEKVIIIPHGIEIKPISKLNPAPSSTKIIGYVGRFVEHKGLIKLIEAFNKVSTKIDDTKLLLVGEGPLEKELIKKINQFNLADKVTIKKQIISENEIFSELDILVVPSEKLEGFGLVVIEAMAYGVPVIVSNLPVFSNLIIDKKNGLVAKTDLANEILFLLENKIIYNKIRDAAYEYVSQNFNVNKILKSYLESVYY